MATHIRRKLDIVIESHLLGRVETMLEKAGATGWTVFQGHEGKGKHGIWREDGLVDAMQTYLIIAICTPEIAQEVLNGLRVLFERHSGVAYVHDVNVMRSERF
jgi:nitrogen regulatory protein PII